MMSGSLPPGAAAGLSEVLASYIEELEEENRQLREMLRLNPEKLAVRAFREALGLSNTQAVALWTLFDAGQAWVSREHIDHVLPQRDPVAGRGAKVVEVVLSNMRRKIGADTIIHRRGIGYALSARGVVICSNALATALPKVAA